MHAVRGPSLSDFKNIHLLRRAVEDSQPEILHCHGAKAGLYGRLAKKLWPSSFESTRVIYSPHGGTIHYADHKWLGPSVVRAEKTLSRWTDGYVFVSDYERRQFSQKFGVRGVPGAVVYAGVPVTPDNPDVARRFDFGFMGMLRDLKGVDVLLEALARLKYYGWSGHARVAGFGDDTAVSRYSEMVQNLHISDVVSIEGPVASNEFFSSVKIVVVPSRAEALGLVAVEACLAGVPTIVTDAGGLPETFIEPIEHIVPKGDAVGLSRRMAEALRAVDYERVLAQSRAEILRKRFSSDRMGLDLISAYGRAR